MKKTSNLDKLVAANMVELADLSDKDKELIDSLSHPEIDAIISAGTKVLEHTKPGEKLFRVVF